LGQLLHLSRKSGGPGKGAFHLSREASFLVKRSKGRLFGMATFPDGVKGRDYPVIKEPGKPFRWNTNELKFV